MNRAVRPDVAQGMAHPMDDTQLNLGFLIDGLYGFRKAFQSIDAGNRHILEATVLQFPHHRQPELGTLGLRHP